MKPLKIKTGKEVSAVFENYPAAAKKKMLHLRELVVESAREIEEITELEETLKWGEPSYLTKYGSTLRMDWKPRDPDQYALYFQCTSRLVETFQVVFNDTFTYEGKRAITFRLKDDVPPPELKYCIKAALMYHKVKHLPTLGI